MEFVSAIISPIVESLMVPVKKQLDYLFSSAKHVRNMNTRMKQPDCTSCDVKNHMETNNISNLEIHVRAHVRRWLKDVEKIKKDAQLISSIGNGCFNLKMRYRARRNAFMITEEMGSLIKENSKIIWNNAQKPLGKVKMHLLQHCGMMMAKITSNQERKVLTMHSSSFNKITRAK
ncbi:unnamed protein product [Lactuca saligna]|uniref:Uncharacterized protein n=1 Tax=Lactuca saligna TaxID=75948 RepID=A0AA35VL87_LACSI|nr:unnamed protein product [Lactuca saligna]